MLRIVELSNNAVKFLVTPIVRVTWCDRYRGIGVVRCIEVDFIGLNLKVMGVGQKFLWVAWVYKGGSQKYPIF